MASTLAVLLLLSACLFRGTVGDDDCRDYRDRSGNYRPSNSCVFLEHCCGTCDNRCCCSNLHNKLSENDQDICSFDSGAATGKHVAAVRKRRTSNLEHGANIIKSSADMVTGGAAIVTGGILIAKIAAAIGVAVVGFVIITVLLICCFHSRCYFYKLCRRLRPGVGMQITTVTNMQNIQQQPAVQAVQYPQYKPVPTQPGYGGQPMQMGPFQGQQYAPGPPPSYQVASGVGTQVMNMQCIQQRPAMQVVQHPQCQPVPTQPGCGGQPMQMGPYQGQQYAPGPPPSYQMARKNT
ncbi:protein shisa-4 [Labeo rohita]|uniref:protein shisa-4 n=1 Tax=Labeo rohita TaxID=84645 RepID=UPI0021E1C4A3|nr:protein shisa-4 [Labeo rohita]